MAIEVVTSCDTTADDNKTLLHQRRGVHRRLPYLTLGLGRIRNLVGQSLASKLP